MTNLEFWPNERIARPYAKQLPLELHVLDDYHLRNHVIAAAQALYGVRFKPLAPLLAQTTRRRLPPARKEGHSLALQGVTRANACHATQAA